MPAVLPAPLTDLPFVELHRVSKKYGAFRLALADVDLEVARSEFVLVTGPGGSGKSTLLRLVGGLEPPSSGTVKVGGAEPARLRPAALAFLRRSIGILPQRPPFIEDRSVLDNVMLPALASNYPRREAETRARAALARVNFDDADSRPRELAAGARQRAALARAIVNRPALLLADDPTANLDGAGADDTLRLLEQFASSGVTVLMASQNELPRNPARARTIRLDHGRIL